MKILIGYEIYLTSVFFTDSVTGAQHIGCHYSMTNVYLLADFLINNRNPQDLQYFGTPAIRLKLATHLYVGYQMFTEYLPEIPSTFIMTILLIVLYYY